MNRRNFLKSVVGIPAALVGLAGIAKCDNNPKCDQMESSYSPASVTYCPPPTPEIECEEYGWFWVGGIAPDGYARLEVR